MAGSKKKRLLIVESPTKAKTLKRYLGDGYEVLASKGHVKDLPKTKLGVRIEEGFKPTYVLLPEKRAQVKKIRESAKKAEEILLGSDPDREGEAIAYHIAQEVRKSNEKAPLRRVLFYEITREGVRRALQEPGEINMNLVYAQQARRVLDRLVGYQVSPFLWKALGKGLSAGRVQTVALRLLVEREKQIQAFVPEKYWVLTGIFEKDGVRFKARLKGTIDGKKLERLSSKEEAEAIRRKLEGGTFQVEKATTQEKRTQPAPPFKTSTLQQEASNLLGFPAKRTMSLAQALYEGVEIEGSPRGLITYMRTDSVRVAETALTGIREALKARFGEEYLNPQVRRFKDAGRALQGAHEAIRPTDPELAPDGLEGKIDRDLWRLYDLIWRRALASQAKPAIFRVQKAQIVGEGYRFEAQGRQLVFEGFYRIYGKPPKDEPVPPLKAGETVHLVAVEVEEKETEPPSRYTEATLIKALEARGVGRPSTYAPTISTLFERRYVERVGKALKPTELGIKVVDLLLPLFPDLFDVGFTAKMEEELDEVEEGRKSWVALLEEFYRKFKLELDRAMKQAASIRESLEEETGEKCPLCGSPLVIRWSRHGRFLACSAFPRCRYTRPLELEIFEGVRCPVCGKEMVVRKGRSGRFLACVDYPKCKGTRPYPTGVQCPKCGGEIVERRSRAGRTFWGCENYPRCDFVLNRKPVPVPCPEGDSPFMVEVRTRRDLFYKCPTCGKMVHPSKVRTAKTSS